MQDPYIDTDGNSYEKSVIMDWLRIKHISPMTRNALEPHQLVPNRALREMIEQFVKDHPEAVANYDAGNGTSLASNLDAMDTTSPSRLNRKPLILFALIDNSGSMALSCGEVKGTESDGYSRLDVVKHTLNTIITALTPEDQVCIIKFHTVAKIFHPLTYMSEQNQKAVIEMLKRLEPENQTNIWDGIRTAIDEIAGMTKEQCEGKNIQLYLLTDGLPTINPPRSISETTVNYLKRKCPEHVKPVINTFGYGNELDSAMLYSLAEIGSSGAFGFIPDSSLVGTIFINALSNSLMQGAESDLSRQALVNDPVISAVSDEFAKSLRIMLKAASVSDRYKELDRFVLFMISKMASLDRSAPFYAKQKQLFDGLKVDCLQNPEANLGQIHKALSNQFYNAWGKHYLWSVLTAYERRLCVNFKDNGMQVFKTERFEEEQKRVEDIFIQLPPPLPSGPLDPTQSQPQGAGMGQTTFQRRPPRSMIQYYQQSGGCFTADSLVFGASRQVVQVSNLAKGFVVLSNDGYTQVEAVIKLRYTGPLYSIGGSMTLTSYHPVRIGESCFFPAELYQQRQNYPAISVQHTPIFDGYVYDVVLANRGVLSCPLTYASGEPSELFAATFGHNVSTDIFQHAYFGDEKIVQDLRKHPDWELGFVVLDNPRFIRDAVSNQIVQLVF